MLMRPSKDEYFMEIASVVAKRSTCLRIHVGAVVVKNGQILSTGYNGAPHGFEHCLDIGCIREFEIKVRGLLAPAKIPALTCPSKLTPGNPIAFPL
jgi:deoxycytidylate deaminase